MTAAFDPHEDDPHREIRDGVRKLCSQFPGEYWRRLDRDAAYPAEFVKALTAAGYLSALIPEEYGGSGLPLSAAAAIVEEIQRAGCNGAACHAQIYIMGAAPAIITWSTARKSGRRDRNIPISCCCSRAPRRSTRPASAPTECPFLSSTCGQRWMPGSRSGQSVP
jgi:alkylation response protein AidB-like acyl-CoA dehydrogenase